MLSSPRESVAGRTAFAFVFLSLFPLSTHLAHSNTCSYCTRVYKNPPASLRQRRATVTDLLLSSCLRALARPFDEKPSDRAVVRLSGLTKGIEHHFSPFSVRVLTSSPDRLMTNRVTPPSLVSLVSRLLPLPIRNLSRLPHFSSRPSPSARTRPHPAPSLSFGIADPPLFSDIFSELTAGCPDLDPYTSEGRETNTSQTTFASRALIVGQS